MESITEALVQAIEEEGEERKGGDLFVWRSPLALKPTLKESLGEITKRFYKYILMIEFAEPLCYLKVAMIYLERLPKGVVTRATVTKLFACGVLVALKWVEDDAYAYNKQWAKTVAVDVPRMNQMELEFCSLLRWKLHVTADEYHNWKR